MNDKINCNKLSENNCEWPKGKPNIAFEQFFVGKSFLSTITPKNIIDNKQQTVQEYKNVTFEPRCRNNWHIHHGVHQILICVSGRGWYQEWGKSAISLKPGDIIDIPEGVKHWHGAQKKSWFQHLVTHVIVGNDYSNEWLEQVTDEEYDKLTE